MRRTIIIAVAILAAACQTPGGGALSPGMDTGATAGGGQGAQTIGGDQGLGQTPQDTVGGQATVNWNFASQQSSSVQMRLIEYAQASNASIEALTAALAATNGAPQTVTITHGDSQVTGGSAEAVGATTGAGDGNNVAPPNPTQP